MLKQKRLQSMRKGLSRFLVFVMLWSLLAGAFPSVALAGADPGLGGLPGASTEYAAGGSAVAIAPNATITAISGVDFDDVADGDVITFNVRITNAAAGDELSEPSVAGVTSTYDGATGVLTIASEVSGGFTGTDAFNAIQEALQEVTYHNTNPVPVEGERTIEIALESIGSKKYFPGTGHLYEEVYEGYTGALDLYGAISWEDARDDAAEENVIGLAGYLATVTSGDEQQFIVQNVLGTGGGSDDFHTYNSAWIGAENDNLDLISHDYRWKTGPETGNSVEIGALTWYPTHPLVNGKYLSLIRHNVSFGQGWTYYEAYNYASAYIVEYGDTPLNLHGTVTVDVTADFADLGLTDLPGTTIEFAAAGSELVAPGVVLAGDPAIKNDIADGERITFEVRIAEGFDATAGDTLSAPSGANVTSTYNSSTGVLTIVSDEISSSGFTGADAFAAIQAELRQIEYSSNTAGDVKISIDLRSIGDKKYFRGTGHLYEEVYGGFWAFSWNTAKTAAEGNQVLGEQGYLATVTSAAENAFITSRVINANVLGDSGLFSWIGAQNRAVWPAGNGAFHWETGPEENDQFFTGNYLTGTPVESRYSNWMLGQPQVFARDIAMSRYIGSWIAHFDFYQVSGYIVEYGTGSLNLHGDVDVRVTPTDGFGVTRAFNVSYVQGEQAKQIAPSVSVVGTDGEVLGDFTVEITGGFEDGDILAVPAVTGVSSSYDAGTGVLSLSTDPADFDAIQAALRQITFYGTEVGTRTITIKHDGTELDSFTVEVTASDFASGSGTADDPWIITTPEHLDNVRKYLGLEHADKHFKLGNDIDLADSEYVDPPNGWDPIGDSDDPFQGSFNGDGQSITGLFIDRSAATSGVGLFGQVGEAGILSDVHVVLDEDGVEGNLRVGGLVGSNSGTIIHCSVTGEPDGAIEGAAYIGGLVGYNNGTVLRSFATVPAGSPGRDYAGGLIGHNVGGTITESYATGSVLGWDNIGGLVGENDEGSITNSYALGSVEGNSNIGGLIGYNDDGEITNTYAAGSVTGTTNVGGLIGDNSGGTVNDSYYDEETTGQEDTGKGIPTSTNDMKIQGTYTPEWDFIDIWGMVGHMNDGYPYLRWQQVSGPPGPPIVSAYPGGVSTGLISWVDIENNKVLGDGTQIASLDDSVGSVNWNPIDAQNDFIADAINFNGGMEVGRYYTRIPFDITDTAREVFSIQGPKQGVTMNGFPWNFGGEGGDAQQVVDIFRSDLIRVSLGASVNEDTQKVSVDSGFSLGNADLLNVVRTTNELTVALNGVQIGERDELPGVQFGGAGGITPYYIGAGHNSVFNGLISEVIVYSRELDPDEKLRVNSYLALKYGLTLDSNYVASNGTTTMWTSASNDGYGHRITGIGRDDDSGLLQKQSKSQANGTNVTIALGDSIAATNAENANNIDSDLSFFVFSDNGEDANYIVSTIEEPDTSAPLNRMERVYKVEKTNWTDTDVTLKLDGTEDLGDIYLVTSTDGTTFANPTSARKLDEHGEITVDSSELQYFTFAKVSEIPAAPTGLTAVAPTTSANDDGQITGVSDALEYRLQPSGAWVSVPTGANEITGLAPGTYEVRVAEDGDTPAGAITEIVVPEVPAAPTGLTAVAPTTSANDDGQITGVSDALEYRLQPSGAWVSVPTGANEITGLAPGTYEVRVAEDGDTPAGAITEITVPGYTAPPADDDDSSGDDGGSTVPPTDDDGTTTPATEVITVDVEVDGITGSDVATRIPISRETQANGSKHDSVSLTVDQAREAVQTAVNSERNIARIVIPDANDEVSQVEVNVELQSVQEISAQSVNLEVLTDNVRILIPSSSLDGVANDLYFRLVPVKEVGERQLVEERARVERSVQSVARGRDVNVVARPMTIETNLQSRPVTLTLPLRDVELPTNAQERQEYLNKLIIFVEHSDGDKELLIPRVVEYKQGQLGLEFGVTKFSTFSILEMEGWQDSYFGAYIKGYEDGTFRPANAVTRAEIAAMVARNLRYDDTQQVTHDPFKDVASSHWAANAIAFVKQEGFMLGDATGAFNPSAPITRAEMVTVIARYQQLALLSEAESAKAFPDIAEHWAVKEIAAVKSQNIVNGYEDGKFRPNDNLTRAEAVKVINLMFERPSYSGVMTPSFTDVQTTHWAYIDIEEASRDYFLIEQ
ncbi:S-layer homology domain-containing protein [Desulfuribacillus alkaliarsenatis]|uniref:SLH domain-containing protein n=1 Tax=Desulfuribacillus alkaliarsenatis TaxID=766136 RepID=A0A1E5G0Y8_9FIRM|nr:S-layer homology domain-containing protein [Desulfuribacillus alkaliarsenatis]OEF96577.1 hypothetical protein BHF68_07990 [Desulfuribacillus alkaliarsenatis]